jgi:hypothetical protein
MEVQMTLEQLAERVPVLEKMMQAELSPKIAYRVKRAVDKVNSIYSPFMDERNKLIQKLGITLKWDELTEEEKKLTSKEDYEGSGEKIVIKPGTKQFNDFIIQINPLLKEVVKFDIMEVELEDLFKEDIKISASEINLLTGLIIKEEPDVSEPRMDGGEDSGDDKQDQDE